MLFSYKAKSNTGEIVEGLMQSQDRFSLARELHQSGSVPLSVTEKRESINLSSMFESLFSKVSTDELIVFTKNLSGMIKAGLTLHRALSVLEKQAKKESFNKILVTLESGINSGETLSMGLAKFPDVFSGLFVSMTRAGEESGNLANSLTEIGANLEKSHALNKKIQGALIYPGVILSAMLIIGVLMFAFVVPTLAGTFKELGVELPATTKAIIALGNFFSNNLILTFVIILMAGFGIFTLLRSKVLANQIDYLVVRLPLIGTLVQELNTARTSRTMASLLVSGVSMTRALEITEEVVQNIYYKKVLEDAIKAVEKGSPFSEVFRENPNLYPVMMSEMVQVGEETGKLSDMLLNIAVFYEDEIENKTKNLSTIIEPVLMVLIGAGVGFFAISMISPLYSILGEIG